MSTYMQAYQGGPGGPGGPSGMMPVPASGSQPYQVPGMPMTGVHPAATPGQMGQMGQMGPTGPMGQMPGPGMQGPHMTPPPMGALSGPQPGYGADSSSVALPKKSKAGLIFLIIAVLAVVGGAIVFVVVSGKDDGGASAGTGSASGTASGTASGSQVASGSGKASGSQATSGSGTASGSQAASGSSGSGTASGSQAASGSGSASGSQAASGSDVASGSGTDGSGSSTEPAVIKVTINSATPGAMVYDGKKALGPTPHVVEVLPDEPLTLTVRARGYKDLTQTVDGSIDTLAFDLTKQAVKPPHPGNGSGSAGSNSQQDQITKYCKEHPDDLRCQAE
jgi:hypothetical protein